MCDDSKYLDSEWIRAAKPHQCDWCFEMIEKGELHERYAGITDHRAFSMRLHLHCLIEANDNSEDDGCWMSPYDRPTSGKPEPKVFRRLKPRQIWRPWTPTKPNPIDGWRAWAQERSAHG